MTTWQAISATELTPHDEEMLNSLIQVIAAKGNDTASAVGYTNGSEGRTITDLHIVAFDQETTTFIGVAVKAPTHISVVKIAVPSDAQEEEDDLEKAIADYQAGL